MLVKTLGEKDSFTTFETPELQDPEDDDYIPDMRCVLGYLNQCDSVANINIGNVMQITPMSINLSIPRNEQQLFKESLAGKISLIVISYFCVSTEIRFQMTRPEFSNLSKGLSPEAKQKKLDEAEFWHTKSLEIVCSCFPSDCPLVNHVLVSYQKHHSPSKIAIEETETQDFALEVIKPIEGIEFVKFRPIIKKLESGLVCISPACYSPA